MPTTPHATKHKLYCSDQVVVSTHTHTHKTHTPQSQAASEHIKEFVPFYRLGCLGEWFLFLLWRAMVGLALVRLVVPALVPEVALGSPKNKVVV
mmetsp:Transcript_57023/g.134216  ORF Transcript_57023/g.134216 Transcript_57023/m.134216 type:complete len:94 (+) Transcript_57023:598-879(+)